MAFCKAPRPLVRRLGTISAMLILGTTVCGETLGASSAAATSRRHAQLSVSSPEVAAGGFVTFTATISTPNPTANTVVEYSMTGTAAIDRDYILSEVPGKFVIPAGATAAGIKLTALTNGRLSGATAKLTLKSASGYGFSSKSLASVRISADTTGTSPTSKPKREVWIAIRTDSAPGSGTKGDPYNGNSAARFDAAMSSLQHRPNLLIHLKPGTFRTSATRTWALRSGWIIQGAGMYKTSIQLSGNVSGMHHGVPCLTSDSNVSTDNVTIRDLTLDCNWAELSTTADTGKGGEKNIKTGAVSIWGNDNLIERVRGINGYGSWANLQEQFLFYLCGSRFADSTNNIIRFCRAELPQGNYGNPFALAGWAGPPPNHILAKSKVISCTAIGINNGLATGFTSGGVNFGNVKDCQINGNTFIDCFGAAYTDTGSFDGLSVTNNTVIRGWEGVGLCNSVLPKQNIHISGNRFLIQNRIVGGGSYGIALAFGPSRNVTIDNNTITFVVTGHGLDQLWGITVDDVTSATIANNTVGPSVSRVTGTSITIRGNRRPDGGIVSDLRD